MKIRPLHDRLLVKPLEAEEKSKGGIIIPDTAKEKPQEGKVVAAGPGKANESGKTVDMEVQKGDRILYSKYSGTEVNLEGEEHLIVREEDILAIVAALGDVVRQTTDDDSSRPRHAGRLLTAGIPVKKKVTVPISPPILTTSTRVTGFEPVTFGSVVRGRPRFPWWNRGFSMRQGG